MRYTSATLLKNIFKRQQNVCREFFTIITKKRLENKMYQIKSFKSQTFEITTVLKLTENP